MEIKHFRQIFSKRSAVGSYRIDGFFFCNILEDADRGLDSSMSLDEIRRIKVQNETAIPYGKYDVIIDWSNHFQKRMLHILNVKGFEGVRIHGGLKPEDTDGCQLVGTYKSEFPDQLVPGSSAPMRDKLFDKVEAAIERGEKVTIEILKG